MSDDEKVSRTHFRSIIKVSKKKLVDGQSGEAYRVIKEEEQDEGESDEEEE